MVPEYTRNLIWGKFLDAGRIARYFSRLSRRHHRRHQFIRIALLVSVMGSVTDLIDLLPAFAAIVFGIIASVLIAIDFSFEDGRKASVALFIAVECGKLESAWERLWVSVNNHQLEEDSARRINSELDDRIIAVTSIAGYSNLTENSKINVKSAEEAYAVIGEQYGEGSE